MLNAIIVDDEKGGRDFLEKLLNKYCKNVFVLSKVKSVDHAIAAIDDLCPDIVFLDIQMPGKDGFKLLDHYVDPPFKVIFTTAHDEYAIKALRWSALDYLLKPIESSELIHAVSLAELNIEFPSNEQKELANQIRRGKHSDKLIVASGNGFKFIKIDQIIRVSASGNYSEIYLLENQRILTSRPIRDYDDMLRPLGFFRVHRSHLINLEYIAEYKDGRSGSLTMDDGFELSIARDRKVAFLKLFKK